MGAGIARTIADYYGNQIRAVCKNKAIGSIVPFYGPGLHQKPILNMISKPVSYKKPTIKNALATLDNLHSFLRQHNIKKLHIPFIGAGLDGLCWFTIEDYIKNNFADLELEITAFYWNGVELDRIINSTPLSGPFAARAKQYRSFFQTGNEIMIVTEHNVNTGQQQQQQSEHKVNNSPQESKSNPEHEESTQGVDDPQEPDQPDSNIVIGNDDDGYGDDNEALTTKIRSTSVSTSAKASHTDPPAEDAGINAIGTNDLKTDGDVRTEDS